MRRYQGLDEVESIAKRICNVHHPLGSDRVATQGVETNLSSTREARRACQPVLVAVLRVLFRASRPASRTRVAQLSRDQGDL